MALLLGKSVTGVSDTVIEDLGKCLYWIRKWWQEMSFCCCCCLSVTVL